jgi:hypothetical protein
MRTSYFVNSQGKWDVFIKKSQNENKMNEEVFFVAVAFPFFVMKRFYWSLNAFTIFFPSLFVFKNLYLYINVCLQKMMMCTIYNHPRYTIFIEKKSSNLNSASCIYIFKQAVICVCADVNVEELEIKIISFILFRDCRQRRDVGKKCMKRINKNKALQWSQCRHHHWLYF